MSFFFFNDTATTEIYTLSLHDALPISGVVRRRVDPTRAGTLLGEDAGVQIHVGQNGIHAALGEAPVVLHGTRGGEPRVARRDQLLLDEVEHLAARVAWVLPELGRGDDRHAAEEIHQKVVVEGPERPDLRHDRRLVREGRVLHRAEEQVGTRDAGVRIVPYVVEEILGGYAGRRPGHVVQLDPLAVVVPVRSPDRHDHLVRADLVHPVQAAAAALRRRG